MSEMVRAMVRRIEPRVAIEKFDSLAGQAAQSLYPDRMLAWVSLGFAGLAAFLCAIGIFGLTSYGVTKRTQEIGVRIVLGATRASIQWMVMREVSGMAPQDVCSASRLSCLWAAFFRRCFSS
jgi:hypothetical protein